MILDTSLIYKVINRIVTLNITGGDFISPMTRSELITKLAERFPQLITKDAEVAVRILIDAISKRLTAGDRIEVRGFGSFSVHVRPSRKGRNPKTGEMVLVPEKRVPHFKAGVELRKRINIK